MELRVKDHPATGLHNLVVLLRIVDIIAILIGVVGGTAFIMFDLVLVSPASSNNRAVSHYRNRIVVTYPGAPVLFIPGILSGRISNRHKHHLLAMIAHHF